MTEQKAKERAAIAAQIKAQPTRSHRLLPAETLMPENSFVYPMYVYIMDGVFRRWEFDEKVTLPEVRRRLGVTEIRRCSLFEHPGARLGDRVH